MTVALEVVDPSGDLDALAAALAPDHGGDDPAGELRMVLGILTAAPRRAPWGTYLARADGVPVGLCSFKTDSTGDGVEIAYGTFPAARGQGVAKAMAAGLVAIAAADPADPVIFAHTLREPNASTRVLTACGFTFDGEAEEPDDGPVWRWVRR